MVVVAGRITAGRFYWPAVTEALQVAVPMANTLNSRCCPMFLSLRATGHKPLLRHTCHCTASTPSYTAYRARNGVVYYYRFRGGRGNHYTKPGVSRLIIDDTVLGRDTKTGGLRYREAYYLTPGREETMS